MLQPTNKQTENSPEKPVSTATVNATHQSVQPIRDAYAVVPVSRRQGKKFTVFYIFVLIALAVVFVLVIKNSQAISDWFRLRGYHPPQQVSELVSEDTMTPYTAHLFYLNRPLILNTVTGFRKYCPENENTIVLGCYHPDQDGIYIYNVPDPTLAGVQQVTAAHEVLHAVYARLSNSQRTYVDGLLESYYKHDLHDPIVQQEVKLYQQTEPNSVMDEMNSTFGTEIANLPTPLENYYQQYFSDRSKIVAYESNYEDELSSRMTVINADDSQLSQMQNAISSSESQLNSEYSHLNAQHAQLNQLFSSGQYASYNSQVDTYNEQVDNYNSQLAQLKNEINSYNNLIISRNDIAGQLTTLDKALDTRLTQQTAQ
jgi:hypothetical protein